MNLSFLVNYIGSLFSKKKNIVVSSENNTKIIKVPYRQFFDPKLYKGVSFNGIVIHHSLTSDGTYKDTDSIRRYHTSYRIDGDIVSKEEFERRKANGYGKVFEKPWSDIGYHGLIERVGLNLEAIKGRDWSIAGAHAGVFSGGKSYGEYNKWFGLCIVGNFDVVIPSDELWDFSLDVCRELILGFNINISNVIGHREVYGKLGVPVQKSCPGNKFDMEKFRKDLLSKI